MTEETLQKDIEALRSEMQSEISSLRKELKLHTHNGIDSSKIPFSSVTSENRFYFIEPAGIIDMVSKAENFRIYADPAEPGDEALVIDAAEAGGSTFIKIGANASQVILNNLPNSAPSTLSGTQKDVEIQLSGTTYYFTVFPTKA